MTLENDFDHAMHGVVETARANGYVPVYFMQMLGKYGGVETARRLLAVSEPQTGLCQLWRLGLLHESMEAFVLQERFLPLFTVQEINEARRRLEELEYFNP